MAVAVAEHEKRAADEDGDVAVPSAKRVAPATAGSSYCALPALLRELHANRDTYLSMLSRDVASCVIGSMLGAWFGATEAHEVGECDIGPHTHCSCFDHHIGFDDTGSVLLTRLCFLHPCHGADWTRYAPEIGRTIVATMSTDQPARWYDNGDTHVECVESPYWAPTIKRYQIDFTPGTHVYALAPPVDCLMVGVCTATDGRGTYAVSTCHMPISVHGVVRNTIVCTPGAALVVAGCDHESMCALAFDPRNGDLLTLCRNYASIGMWRLRVLRPGRAPQ
jgi:hypothetical protein